MRNIAPILRHLHVTRRKFLVAIASVPDERWQKAPSARAWSAAEIVAHVTLVERAVNRNSNRILSDPPDSMPLHKRLHLPLWISTWRVIRVKASNSLKPEFIGGKDKLIASLTAARKLTTDFLEANFGRDLSVYRAPHPFLGNLNLYKWQDFIAYHEERHRKQILEIVNTFQL